VSARYRLLARLLPYLRPYWPVLLVGGMLAMLVSGAEASIAWLVKPAMDEIFLKRDVAMLRLIPLALLGAYLVKGAGRFHDELMARSDGIYRRLAALQSLDALPAR
jgi:subfamily B ATP-binding cassette protein MsbA